MSTISLDPNFPEHLNCWICSPTDESEGGSFNKYWLSGVADDGIAEVYIYSAYTTAEKTDIARHIEAGPRAVELLRNLVKQTRAGGPVDIGPALDLLAAIDAKAQP